MAKPMTNFRIIVSPFTIEMPRSGDWSIGEARAVQAGND
jgi:hypothetical protein